MIETTNDTPATAAKVHFTSENDNGSSDGWAIDNQSFNWSKTGRVWAKASRKAKIRIYGEFHKGIRVHHDDRVHESCHGGRTDITEPCPLPIPVPEPADPENPPTGVFKSNLMLNASDFPDFTGWWERPPLQMLKFYVSMHPLPSGNNKVRVQYGTYDRPGWWGAAVATKGRDYIGKQGYIEFTSSSPHTQLVTVEVIDDQHEDSGEQMEFTIYNCKKGTGSNINDDCGSTYTITKSSVYGTILNSEEAVDTPNLRISDLTVTEDEGATAVFTISSDVAVTAPVSVDYATQDDSAEDGIDYTGGSGTAFIAHGASSVTLSVPILNNEVYTGDRQFTLNLSNPVNASTLRGTATATIQDDEPAPLTAKFGTVPQSHNGSGSFAFFVKFSEGTRTTYLRMQNDVFTITNGEITHAERFMGLRHRWKFTVQPDNGADVTIHLPETIGCSGSGAVCTDATPHRALSNSLTATVTGTPLTARFNDLPEHHNTVDTFSFTLEFSENANTTPEELRDNAFTINGGQITAVARTETSNNLKWTVTVQPGGTGDVVITMPAATDCAASGQICTSAGELLSAEHSATITGQVAEDPPTVLLTASFANVPADHNGGNFTFQLTFSENVEAGYARIRDHAFTVTGATIASASRITQGSNQGWNVEVNPTGNEAITITLPETTNCNAARAICTDDERKLSHATSEIVAGPPTISVSDATVQEAEGAVLEFSVTLSHLSSRTVTVAYATSDGSAQAGSDYTAASGTLTFNAGDTSQTVQVTVLTDQEDEGQETLTLTLSNASSATLADATGTGTIENGESSSGTQEDPPAEDPPANTPVVSLTATFANMPATHDGTTFTFDLSFSENVKAGYERIRDHAFTISGGEIANAQRKTQGSNQNWTITVKPDGNDAITITLPETSNCDATSAICTYDRRKLSGSTSNQVTGPL